ncbi:phospholipase A and acyltransferase 3-like [Haliotis rubra]|uniref:phospholipase A and acyltransferase 3-like n=1 Tax=Haliotis rubra TaxID=36100 RepID=UPI001EE4EE6A|nr:phospholipase A and acyltransferase 3-like [Haliotis rubra]
MSSLEVQRHNQTVLDRLKPGDLVEFKRGLYSHWGVAIKNNYIVHRTRVDGPMRSGPQHALSVTEKVYDKGKIRKQNFWDVVGDSKAYKNNALDKIFICSILKSKTMVYIKTLLPFSSCPFTLNNYVFSITILLFCFNRHFDSAEIVVRAVSQVGDVGYNLLSKNCEHFATDCRYGIEVSGQVCI